MNTNASLHRNLIALLDAIGKYKIAQKPGLIHVMRECAFVDVHL